MGVATGQGRRELARGAAHVADGVVASEVESFGEGVEVAHRYAQRLHELFKPCGVAVELLEDGLAGELDLGLGLAGLERLSEVTPEPVGPGVAHLEEPPDIGGAVLVAERCRLGAVAVAAVGPLAIALEDA